MEEQDEGVKVEARQFMSDMLSGASSNPAPAEATGKTADMPAWKASYVASNKDAAMMEEFWSKYYDPVATSIWTMVYDEADSNESLEETVAIATDFMKQTESIRDHCFGVIHTLESLEVEGVWFFNGPDPEELFGVNPDTSWFTWSQMGPDANEHVKNAVASIMAPTDSKLHGKIIKDTQAFC